MKAEIFKYSKTENLLDDAKSIIDCAKEYAVKSVNWALVQRNWLLGERIAQEELKGENRAEYGKEIIKKLSKQLTEIYGSEFTKTNLYNFYNFFKEFPDIFHTVCGKSLFMYLDWSHFRILLQEENKEARAWYASESVNENWSVRTLQRNISSQYYFRMLKSPKKEEVRSDTDEDIARYSVLSGSEQLFATKYKLCLPTEEQLRKEIESQKNQYFLAHPEKSEDSK